MHARAMNDRHRELHSLLATLGHSSRFRIALLLGERERGVGELALAVGLSQSCTTRHVQALERAGIVRSRRDGKRVVVTLRRERPALATLLGLLGEPDGDIVMVDPHIAAPTAPPAADRTARSPGGRRARRKPSPPPPERASEELTHPPAPPSGKHPAPSASEERPARRPSNAIEDFLL